MIAPLEPFPLPDEWGRDELTHLMERAYRNRVATFANKPEFQRLIGINECFRLASSDWTNPTNQVAALLLIRSHAAFFSAAESAAASMLPEVFLKARSCLEHAAYALLIKSTPSLEEVWLRRHDSDAAKAKVRNSFTQSALKGAIRAKDGHAATVFERLYEEAIDFGGHPNERGITGSLKISQTEDGREVQQVWLHGDGPQLDMALRSTARAGICALTILQNVFPERFELLGVNVGILELRRGL